MVGSDLSLNSIYISSASPVPPPSKRIETSPPLPVSASNNAIGSSCVVLFTCNLCSGLVVPIPTLPFGITSKQDADPAIVVPFRLILKLPVPVSPSSLLLSIINAIA